VNNRLRTIRVKATLASTLVVAVALTVAGLTLVQVLRSSQIRSIDTTLELRATDVESLIAADGGVARLSVEDDEDGFVQILDVSGAVVAASGNIEGEPSLVVGTGDPTITMSVPEVDSGNFRVRSDRVGGGLTIVVGTSLENVDRVLATVRGSLLLGLPLLLVLIAVLVWVVVGRALRPVEAIRSEVADIGGGDLHRRVPVTGTHDEIGRLAMTMNEMLDRLEASSVAQARFVSDASHELRTPIAVIRHELEIALRSGDAVLLREAAAEVLDEDLRMQRLVEDLLLLARRDGRTGGSRVVERPLVDLDDIALGEAHRVATDKRVDTSCVSAGQVRGNEDQLVRVMRNLIDNALSHAKHTVRVSVSSTHDGFVRMHVEDDGDGVADSDRERIFERFARSDEARARDDGGSGLGLAIVAGIVNDHGGTVAVDTSPSLGGARFTATFADARV